MFISIKSAGTIASPPASVVAQAQLLADQESADP